MSVPQYYLLSAVIVAGVCALLLLAYLPRIRAWFGAFSKGERLVNETRNRLAVLVPARNESQAIGPLLESLSRQSYDDFAVFVIVSDPADPTIKMAEEKGFATVVAADQTCKSDALDAAVQRILSRDRNEFDAYLILDADTSIKDDYLSAMNDAMASGCEVIVSKKIVKNYALGGKSLTFQGAANGYIWTVFDQMGNKYKSKRHISLFTVGSGLLVSKKIILTDGGWPYKSTLTEDCELAGDMIANHWSSYYAEFAPIYMEEAPSLEMTNKRRNRWMSGLTSAQMLYRRKDFSFGSARDIYFSYSIFISYAYFGLLGLFALGNAAASLWYFVFDRSLVAYPLFSCLGALLAIYLSFLFMAVVGFCAMLHDVKGHWLFRIATLFVVPFHYLGYFPIMVKVFLGKGPKKWESIARVGNSRDIRR